MLKRSQSEHLILLRIKLVYNIARINLSNQIQFRERLLHIPIVHAPDVSKQIPREKQFLTIGLKMLLNNWFIRQLCVHRDMKHTGSLESTKNA